MAMPSEPKALRVEGFSGGRSVSERSLAEPGALKWWQTGVIYQIYPASFKDNVKEQQPACGFKGFGDLQGITSKLDYLKELGIAAIWLSPIYASPFVDMGYDISDFRNIDECYGTLYDFQLMTMKAHELGIKVVLDFVPNHSSDQHEWFQNAINKDAEKYEQYKDYYVFRDKKNNWRSVFDDSEDGTAWTHVEGLDKYYLHQFHKAQPDLNYRSEKLVEEMKEILVFWLLQGVDGFRVDAIPHLFEDKDFRDNTASIQYTTHQPETFDMVQQWRELLEDQSEILDKDLVLMLEAYADVETTMRYFGDESKPGGHFPFNFFLITDLNRDSLATDLNNTIAKWIENVPEFGWSNWVIGNHDQHRVGSRLGEELIDAMNMLVLLLPGTAITYNGEEIGMLDNTDLTVVNCEDKMACPDGDETDEGYYQNNTRDFERTPFQWDSSEHAGFCKDCTPWLPVNENYETLNAADQTEDPNSHLSIYKKLVNLRNEPVIQTGALKTIVLNDNVFSFSRQNDTFAYVVIINLRDNTEIVNVAEQYEELEYMQEYVSHNFYSSRPDLSQLSLPPYSSVVLGGPKRIPDDNTKWWQNGVIYQIYPRSFKDTNGDGVGDLKGIDDSLEYLKTLGVSAIWLSPVFKSPNLDMGYDISDFEKIDPLFGTMDDMLNMIAHAHRLGIKVIFDFVPNHSSADHEWFQSALADKNSDYFDYYVWRDDNGTAPNNWKSVFDKETDGSAWTCVPEVDSCYLHQFHEKQPDLNYFNPNVVNEMKGVLSFWIRRGVDGFRVDAVQHLFEDEEFRDNPQDFNQYTEHLPGTYEMIKQWHQLLDDHGRLLGKDLILMLEVYADIPYLMPYFGSEDRKAGDFPFNFLILSQIHEGDNAEKIVTEINKWIEKRPSWGWNNWVVGNHDNHRVGSRMGQHYIDAMNMLVLLLPGTAITYNGEEIGMLDNTDLTVNDCQDPMACPQDDTEEEYYQSHSRDFGRTPFHWDGSENAGFSSGTPWLPVYKNYKTVNVENEEGDGSSHLSIYKKLVALRNEPVSHTENMKLKALKETVLAFARYNDTYAYLVLINFGDEEITVDITAEYDNLPEVMDVYVSHHYKGSCANLDELVLEPYASLVLVPGSDECINAAAQVTSLWVLMLSAVWLTWFLRVQ